MPPGLGPKRMTAWAAEMREEVLREVRDRESEREEEVEVDVLEEATVEIEAEEGDRLPDRLLPSKTAGSDPFDVEATIGDGSSDCARGAMISSPGDDLDVEAAGAALPSLKAMKPLSGSNDGADGRRACGRSSGVCGQLVVVVALVGISPSSLAATSSSALAANILCLASAYAASLSSSVIARRLASSADADERGRVGSEAGVRAMMRKMDGVGNDVSPASL